MNCRMGWALAPKSPFAEGLRLESVYEAHGIDKFMTPKHTGDVSCLVDIKMDMGIMT